MRIIANLRYNEVFFIKTESHKIKYLLIKFPSILSHYSEYTL
jgi:hypothetical protein